MTAASIDLLAALERVVGHTLRPTPHRVMSAAEQAAEDYWASVGEQRRDEALMPVGRGDDTHMQERADNYLEGCA